MCKICSSNVEERPAPAAKIINDKIIFQIEIEDINENLQKITLYDKYHHILMSYNQLKERE